VALPAARPADVVGRLSRLLSPNRRQILRRKERGLRREHTVAVTDYDAERLDEGWGHLLALHEQRWEGGVFRDARSERLQRQFARAMAEQQRLWLTTLDLDGRPVAAWYGFASGDTVYFYRADATRGGSGRASGSC